MDLDIILKLAALGWTPSNIETPITFLSKTFKINISILHSEYKQEELKIQIEDQAAIIVRRGKGKVTDDFILSELLEFFYTDNGIIRGPDNSIFFSVIKTWT